MAADSLIKASTPEPLSKSKTSNWVARGGGLPAYVQHIAKDIMQKRGVPESQAIQIAIGAIKRWAAGGGSVDATTRAAARKALGEWEKLKAQAKLKETPMLTPAGALAMELDAGEHAELVLLEWPMTAGQQLSARGTPAAAGAKTRSGGSADFESAHPRGRGGAWVIKGGAQGAAVQRIQKRVGGTKADGKFGVKTTAAVRAFQRRHGLQVDGIVGAQTAAALRGQSNAAKVKPGQLTAADRSYLAGEKPKATSKVDWRTQGDGKRHVVLKDGSTRKVSSKEYDHLKRMGRLSSKTVKRHGD